MLRAAAGARTDRAHSRRSTSAAACCCGCPTARCRPIAAGDVFPLTAKGHACIGAAGEVADGRRDELVFAPLGGIGEIGMNLSIYGFGDERRRNG